MYQHSNRKTEEQGNVALRNCRRLQNLVFNVEINLQSWNNKNTHSVAKEVSPNNILKKNASQVISLCLQQKWGVPFNQATHSN